MRTKPMLFNTEMVRAMLDERKTVTRRVIKPQPEAGDEPLMWCPVSTDPKHIGKWFSEDGDRTWNPPCEPNDILYVRETWAKINDWINGWNDQYVYRADWPDGGNHPHWHPSIHMPKEAARIWLRVTSVRAERLQDINERGTGSAEREGFVNDINLPDGGGASATKHFAECWDSTIKLADLDRYGWDANPFVWVITFELCEKPESEE